MKKQAWLAAGGILALLSVVFGLSYLKGAPPPAQPPASSSDTSPPALLQPVAPPTEEPYQSPVDFSALQEQNPDIRAWLSVPGLGVEGAVLCREGDNSYYLRRNDAGEYAVSGCYFIEDYNEPDFSDPVTIIYGHNIRGGKMFGDMQEKYSDGAFFAEHNTFTVYTPEGEYQYQIFAAVPYGNKHILYYHNFHSFPVTERFLEEICSIRSLYANVDRTVEVEEGDRMVILSTCQDGDRTQRYLVLGLWKAGGEGSQTPVGA